LSDQLINLSEGPPTSQPAGILLLELLYGDARGEDSD
jgi:hypothetical protein